MFTNNKQTNKQNNKNDNKTTFYSHLHIYSLLLCVHQEKSLQPTQLYKMLFTSFFPHTVVFLVFAAAVFYAPCSLFFGHIMNGFLRFTKIQNKVKEKHKHGSLFTLLVFISSLFSIWFALFYTVIHSLLAKFLKLWMCVCMCVNVFEIFWFNNLLGYVWMSMKTYNLWFPFVLCNCMCI